MKPQKICDTPIYSAVVFDDDNIFAVYTTPQGTGGDIYGYTGTPLSWVKVGGPGKKFVWGDSWLYGLSPDNKSVFRWTKMGQTWNKIGEYVDIYGGAGGLLGIESQSGDVYLYSQGTKSWTKIGGPGKMFTVGTHMGEFKPAYVYGLSPDSKSVWQWTGIGTTWNQIGGPASAIYAGGDKLYATNPDSGDIYQYDQATKKWTKIGGPGKIFAVDSYYGDICGLSVDGSAIFHYKGQPMQWEKIGDAASNIWMGWGYMPMPQNKGGPSRFVLAQEPQTKALLLYEWQV
jgi:hypothetical protein